MGMTVLRPEWMPADDPSKLRDVRLRLMLGHWNEAAAQGIPSTDFIDPAKVGDLLGWTFLWSIEPDPLRFRYLTCGTKVVRRIGFDMTGKYADEHPNPEVRPGILSVLSKVATTGRPHHRRSRRIVDGQEVRVEVLVVPLAAADGTVDHLLGAQIFDTPGAPKV